MHKLLYVSSTHRDFPQGDLQAILKKSREKNALFGVSGLLLYLDGGFLQVLEGEKDVLSVLYGTIAKDARHWEAKLLLDHSGPRNFGKWSMGFKSLSAHADNDGVVGVTQQAIRGLISPGGAGPILDVLIKTFHAVQGGE